eukprot:g3496.t1
MLVGSNCIRLKDLNGTKVTGQWAIKDASVKVSSGDWIAISKMGSDASEYVTYEYNKTGGREGAISLTMSGILKPEGKYVLRYVTQDYKLRAESSSFTINIAKLTNPKVRRGTLIAESWNAAKKDLTVRWSFSGYSPTSSDWIALCKYGSLVESYLTYAYVTGTSANDATILNCVSGYVKTEKDTFVVRYYTGDKTCIAQSAPFKMKDVTTPRSNDVVMLSSVASKAVTGGDGDDSCSVHSQVSSPSSSSDEEIDPNANVPVEVPKRVTEVVTCAVVVASSDTDEVYDASGRILFRKALGTSASSPSLLSCFFVNGADRKFDFEKVNGRYVWNGSSFMNPSGCFVKSPGPEFYPNRAYPSPYYQWGLYKDGVCVFANDSRVNVSPANPTGMVPTKGWAIAPGGPGFATIPGFGNDSTSALMNQEASPHQVNDAARRAREAHMLAAPSPPIFPAHHMSSVASNCHHDNDDENVDHHRSRDEAEKEEEEFVAKNEFGVTMGIGGSDDDAVFEEPMSWANALWHVDGPLKLLDEPKADARRASAADDDSIPFRPVVEAAAADERGVKREAENKTLSDTRVQPAPRSSPFLSCDRHLVEKWLKSRLFVYAALFVVPYMTGIHMSFFSHIDGFDVTFDSSVFDSAGDSTTGVVALVLLLTMMVAIFVVHLRLACVKDVWKSMATTCLGVLVVVALTYGLFFSDSNLASVSFHFHHATIGIIIVALVRFPNKVSLIVAALFIGSIVDGICKWSEWNWLSTWTVENPASSAEVNVDFPSVQPPSLHILFPNITATSIALTWPSAELLSSALNATCVGVALHMNNDPSAVLLYDRLGSNTGVCGALRCEQDVRGLFSNTAYSFQYACIGNLGNYQYNPVGWEVSTL